MPAMEESGRYGEAEDVNMADDDATLIPAAAPQPPGADVIKKLLQRYVF